MTDKLIPEGFRELNVTDDFVGLIGPLWFKVEGERLRVGYSAMGGWDPFGPKASVCGSACHSRPATAIRWAGRMAGCWSPWPTW